MTVKCSQAGSVAVLDSNLSERLNNLMAKGSMVVSSAGGRRNSVHGAPFAEWRAQSLHLLTSLLGPHHTYTVSFGEATTQAWVGNAEYGLGILRAVHQDLASGHLTTNLRELVHAEVFADFLDMADYLLTQQYKDPAAVLGGGVLEERLRQLCQKHNVNTEVQARNGTKPKPADTMNADLVKAGVYDALVQKNVTAWLDLRNKAAHGHYADYDATQVEHMLRGVRDFAARFPA